MEMALHIVLVNLDWLLFGNLWEKEAEGHRRTARRLFRSKEFKPAIGFSIIR